MTNRSTTQALSTATKYAVPIVIAASVFAWFRSHRGETALYDRTEDRLQLRGAKSISDRGDRL